MFETDELRTGALLNALERNEISTCRALLESGKKPDALLDQYRRTALHIASGLNHIIRVDDMPQRTSVELILEFGASTSTKDVYGNTPLHSAALAGMEISHRDPLQRWCGSRSQKRQPLDTAPPSRQGRLHQYGTKNVIPPLLEGDDSSI